MARPFYIERLLIGKIKTCIEVSGHTRPGLVFVVFIVYTHDVMLRITEDWKLALNKNDLVIIVCLLILVKLWASTL